MGGTEPAIFGVVQSVNLRQMRAYWSLHRTSSAVALLDGSASRRVRTNCLAGTDTVFHSWRLKVLSGCHSNTFERT